jgi:MFS family permease
MDNNFKRYILFWLSGSVSQLGSSMTSFALILWTYKQTGSAMSVSLMSFCSYLPYIFVSLLAGGFVDKHYKKLIMLVSDSVAAICALIVLLLWSYGTIEIWHIYLINCVIGFMNSFQMPAQSVAIGIMVPKNRLHQVSGMDSFSNNLVSVVSPILASAVFAFGGLGAIIAIDLLTFMIAFIVLLVCIKIPEKLNKENKREHILSGCIIGFRFLFKHKELWYIILTMAAINFFSRLTYENILSPMILARSNNNTLALGIVNTIMGVGGIIGGLIVSTRKQKLSSIKMIYFSAAISFLFGDVLMGLGQNIICWSIAGVAASIPIPFIMSGQRVILYNAIPKDMQGRVFSVRNAIQYSSIPIGILLGGYLADYIFEPFMKSNSALANILRYIVGAGNGNGMAVMFLCTGVLGFVCSILSYGKKEIKEMDKYDGLN